jgi:membrane-associated phospholipid phosphatase
LSDPQQTPRASNTLRVAERVALAFFTYAWVASWFFPISRGERTAILLLNAVAIGVLLLLGRYASPTGSSFLPALRDWLPCVLIVLAYRESGLFLAPDISHRLDNLFIVWDRALLGSAWFKSVAAAGAPWLARIMELAYLFVYPFIPLGFAAVYFAEKRSAPAAAAQLRDSESTDRYWTAVLLAVLASYVLFPFFPLTPPRVLFHDLPAAGGPGGTAAAPLLRHLNFWILGHYSVQACIFPSGHVAGAVATALAVCAVRRRLGIAFIFAAAVIAVSTVFGRYHYTADALAGAALGVGGFLLAKALVRRPPQDPAGIKQPS